ncbi:hypothetical protein T458_15295 [Brevibacillus panacihumi W25]|uniref:Uncharacterized protein n=1 Tax=Brevibacillus panacihumi W25 TaxID=1408254 RepID=V6M145_9BACL|nr:hypothetical protein [Brevibacillus panacihumi]EST52349.1 hypothetical protein T458_15295 [Brevibacillus panacihumi W25]
MRSKRRDQEQEPTVAPGLYGHDPLEAKASETEIENGEYTSVTKLFLDRTPEE